MARPSVRDVAELAGVSVGTVSNVLNRREIVAAPTVSRVDAAIRTLGFVPNEAARQLREGRSRAIGLVLPDLTNPFFARLARGIEEAAAESDAAVLIGNSGFGRERRDDYLALFEHHRVRGLLVFAFQRGQDADLHALARRGIVTVAIGPMAASAAGSSVAIDDVAGGRLAVEHLLSHGRRDIMFVGGPVGGPHAKERLAGAEAAVRDHDGDVRFRVIETVGLDMEHGAPAAAQILALTPDDRPDAIFAGNDALALELLGEFRAAGIRVPEDIALIGYDDVPVSSSRWISLSSIRQPADELGREAVHLLLERMDGPDRPETHLTFPPTLVVRDTTRGERARIRSKGDRHLGHPRGDAG